MDKLRFVLMGCGRISAKHAEALQQIDDVRLVAVCDPIISKAKSVGEKWQVPYYTDIEVLLSHEQVDVVNILTPSGLHSEHVKLVASCNKHIVVEKPMALRLEDADEMIRLCDEHGIKLFVVKQNRYNLPVVKLREALEEGRFGKLVLGTVRVRWARDQRYYDQDAWRGTWAMDGGVFANQASHHVDLLEWMMGEVESVSAKSVTSLVNVEVEDTGIAILKFKNGALGVVEATTATRPKDLEGSLSILGEKGTVEIGGFAVNEMKTWNFVEPKPQDVEVLAKYNQNPPNVYGYGHITYLRNVVDSIINDKRGLVDGLEGRKSLELINAIYESIETRKEIHLRFTPQWCRLGVKMSNNNYVK
jgi:UDP-N-acetyl-2-amino-2-deoxyglucuronate dehydrogenase